MTKGYFETYEGYQIEIKLVKNGWWRWYGTIYSYSAMRDEPERTGHVSMGSNALTRWGAMKEFRKEVRDYVYKVNGGLKS